MKRTSFAQIMFASLGVGFVGLLLFVAFETHTTLLGNQEESFLKREVRVESTPTNFGLPVTLIIPSIGVSTTIQHVGLSETGNGEMDVPTNFTDVGWYQDGPRPGMLGSSVIDGHFNGKNIPRAVFYNLSKLQSGDLVTVIDEYGATLNFEVMTVKTYGKDASTEEVFSTQTDRAGLNLITCAGDWIKSERLYDKRTVVFTELLSSR